MNIIPRLLPRSHVVGDAMSLFDAFAERLPRSPREKLARPDLVGPLRVLLDPALDRTSGEVRVVLGLRDHPRILLYGVNEPDLRSLSYEWDESAGHFDVTYETPAGEAGTWMEGNSEPRIDMLLARDMGCSESAIIQALELQRLGSVSRMDLLITENPILHPEIRRQEPLIPRVNAFPPPEALACVGLFLRSQADFSIAASGRSRLQMHPDIFYMDAVHTLVPGMGRLWSSVAKASDNRVRHLAYSIAVRLDRFLRERDRLHRASHAAGQNHSAGDELAALEAALFQLLGAFDATERLVALSLGYDQHVDATSGRLRDRKAWRKAIRAEYPEVGRAVWSNGYHYCREAMAELRNTIHGQAFLSGYVKEVGQPANHRVHLGLIIGDKVDRLVSYADEREPWVVPGLVLNVERDSYLDPAGFVEVVGHYAFGSLNSLLTSTLDQVDWADTTPPTPPQHCDALRALVSLGLPAPATLRRRELDRPLVERRRDIHQWVDRSRRLTTPAYLDPSRQA